ncbi:transcriptional regulator with AAA-type ATPase domain/transcriptional regulatory protein LevR [Faecalicoccus acidiformans]|uniref:Transcriptional regulator with AAA-type ATPase domain/transcriptional regulatory protein LevR n=1 Tax=Faecalicoccus acidiformans TaxID=915173 RepID=A0A7W8D566_9FIRM|nr:sigma 54-interacting transcriptional regulator [Faecalicoccus acidiformans]MBB5185735.1 transcriptional regulator with AAA-type ATPase domain/transcriptional regulatory protein LevR [Faecalicoccus acidiformans]
MGRKEKIYNFLKDQRIFSEDMGLTTLDIANQMNLQRHNVSSDLNELCREGLLNKTNGRPVRYWAQKRNESAFSIVIGFNGSLKKSIEIAKASMIYPPNGLNTIISGPSGSGKSFLAERMYAFCIEKNIIPHEAPFTIFNCADYASNPQLLLSQLFGHVKGSFTGADADYEGIISKSNGGVLFLDEVHRLPPEGQEMLFLFIDKGYFFRLGDSVHPVYAQERIIAATSEDPQKTMLTTFLRRFPSQIMLPSLVQRPIQEKYELIKYYFQLEATHLGISLLVRSQCIVALMAHNFTGNIGGLKNTIRLVCANAFLNYLSSNKIDDLIRIYIIHLPKEIQIEYLNDSVDNKLLIEMFPEDEIMFFHQSQDKLHSSLSSAYSSEIENIFNSYYDNGLTFEEIKKLFKNDIHGFIKELEHEDYPFDEKLHHEMSSLKYRLEVNEDISLSQDSIKILEKYFIWLKKNPVTESDIQSPKRTLSASDHFFLIISKELHEIANNHEIYINDLNCLIAYCILDQYKQDKTEFTEILVICHGESTATSLVNVAIQLINYPHIHAIDMPLDHTLKQIEAEILNKFNFKKDSDILLIIDMGSLKSLKDFIRSNYQAQVYSIDMASTLIVLDACKLAKYDEKKAYEIMTKITESYNIRSDYDKEKKVIVTSCLTGEGTAERLACYLKDFLDKNNIRDVEILSYGSEDDLSYILTHKNVIAIIGTVNPHFNNISSIQKEIPFIGIERLLFGDGEKLLQDLVCKKKGKMVEYEKPDQIESLDEVKQLATQFISENIDKAYKEKILTCTLQTLEDIEESLQIHISVNQTARFLIHYAFCIERLIDNDPVTECADLDDIQSKHSQLFSLVRQAIIKNLPSDITPITDAEVGYITMIFL